VWEREIAETLTNVQTLILDKGTSTGKAAKMLDFVARCREAGQAGIVVVNYETARLLPLDAVRWKLAITDESHRIASHSSAQSKQLARMCKDIPYKVAMTGTPFSDRPLMAYGQMRWLRPQQRGGHMVSLDFGNWETFFDTYTHYYVKDNIKIPVGWKNTDQLENVIAPYTMRVSRDNVLDLPPRMEIIRPVILEPAHQRAYTQLYKDMVSWIDGNMILAQNVLVLGTRLHQMTGGRYQPFDMRLPTQSIPNGQAKLDALEDLLDEIGYQPVIVFSRFTDDVHNIQQRLGAMGLTHLELTGSKDLHMRWQAGEAQVLVCNIAAGGTGINLTRAHYVIYYSFGYSRTDFEQSMDRVWRYGQTERVFVYYLLAQDTIDEDIFAALKSKGEVSEKLKERLYERR
jgi:SNF2 family DNA or RNA helicase